MSWSEAFPVVGILSVFLEKFIHRVARGVKDWEANSNRMCRMDRIEICMLKERVIS